MNKVLEPWMRVSTALLRFSIGEDDSGSEEKSTKAVQAGISAHHPEAVLHRHGSNQDPDLVQAGQRRNSS
jgi:hypothetical protein